MNPQEDLDLVTSILSKRDRVAETKLYKKYYSKIFYKVRSFKHDVETAKDITADILLKIFTNLQTYTNTKANFNSWVMSITSNHLVDLYRKEKNKIITVSYETITTDDDEAKKTFNQLYYNMEEELEAKEDVENTLAGLSYSESELICLKYFYGYDNSELSYHYNTTNNKISFKINYIKKKISDFQTPKS